MYYLIFIILFIIVLLTPETEYFDEPIPIIYINLDNRPDRKERMEKLFDKYGLRNYNRLSATYIPSNGHKGCAHSHYNALKYAREKGWDKVLILEDDFKFDITPEEFQLKKIPKNNWNVLLLSAMWEKSKPYNDEIHKLLGGASTTSGYIVKKHYIPKLENLFKNCYLNMSTEKTSKKGYEPWAIDQKWKELQNEDWYIYSPKLGTQDYGIKSSIQSSTKYN